MKSLDNRIFGKNISNEINNKMNNISKVNFQNNRTKNYASKNNFFMKKKNKENIIDNQFKKLSISCEDILLKENIQDNFRQPRNNISIQPNIYKNSIKTNNIYLIDIKYNPNPIEEYNDDIMKNLFLKEINNRANYQLLKRVFSQSDIFNRLECINLALYVNQYFRLRQETFHLAINIFDRYLEKIQPTPKFHNIYFKNVLLACIFISSKYEEIYPPQLDDYHDFFLFSKDEIFKLENDILGKLKFELLICSPYLFLTKFFDSMKNETQKVLYGAHFILELCLTFFDFCSLKPSLQAAISLYISKKILSEKNRTNRIWSAQNEFDTGYSEEEIKRNIKIAINILRDFFAGNIIKDIKRTAIYKKFNSPKYLEVVNFFRVL